MLGRNGMRRLGASILAFAVSLTTAVAAQAQGTATVTGRVTTEAGQPLFGANVTIDALTISVGTNEEGRYTINIPAARVRGQQVVLRVRSFGYVPEVKSITLDAGSQTHDFVLKQDVNRLSQVVVTGVTAGTEIKKLPFTVAQVTAEDMPVPGANPLAQLQGKVPGANIVGFSGRPGTAPAIILRGPQSINASGRGQDPLIIIDGVISQGTLQDINPQDIENVEVVKGAAAASLYGSRAGNGVIQITTRSGKSVGEGIRFRTQAEYGTNSIEREYKYPRTHFMVMNEDHTRFCIGVPAGNQSCARTVDIYQETYRINNDGDLWSLAPATFVGDAGIATNPGQVNARSLYQVNNYPRTFNPIRQFVTNGETYNATVDATGRIGRTNFFASGNQFRQEGAVRLQPGYTRNALRLNIDQQLASSWQFGVRTSYTQADDYNSGGTWFGLTRQPANATLFQRDSRGRLFIRSVPQAQGQQNLNPAYGSENFVPLNRINRFLGQVTARWQPLLWMDAELNVGFDGRDNMQETQQDRGYRSVSQAANINLGNVNRSMQRNQSYNASVDLTARRSFMNDNLATRTTFRTLFEAQDDRGFNLTGQNLAVPGLRDPDAAITNFGIGGFSQQVRQLGMFWNVNADWQGRYIVEGLVRRDGASLFGEARRWQTYGRGSLAWRMSEEQWFGLDAVSDLKLRASLGQAGNRPSFAAQYETFTLGTGGALSPNQLGNTLLAPEVSTELEIGFDIELFNKYALTVTHANNKVDQQIMPVPLSASLGAISQWRNVGEITNKTIEVSLNLPLVQTRDLNYSARVNFDRTLSTISRLDIPQFFVNAANQQGTETMFLIKEGNRMGEIFGRKFVKNCSQLPASHQGQCGGAGSTYQKNSDGFIVYVGQGNTMEEGITKNLWFTKIPKQNAPWGAEDLGWGLPILERDDNGNVPVLPVGQAIPDYRWSLQQTLTYKKFSVYALLDATVGKSVWNIGRQWSMGDFMHRDADQAGKSVADARPLGYYFRAVSTGGIGGLYDVLAPNNNTTEDASFVKVREVSLGYRLGRLAGVGDWSLSLVGRNLLTFTNYSGFDPEVGLAGGNLGSGVLNAVDGFTFPNLRSFTFQIGTSF